MFPAARRRVSWLVPLRRVVTAAVAVFVRGAVEAGTMVGCVRRLPVVVRWRSLVLEAVPGTGGGGLAAGVMGLELVVLRWSAVELVAVSGVVRLELVVLRWSAVELVAGVVRLELVGLRWSIVELVAGVVGLELVVLRWSIVELVAVSGVVRLELNWSSSGGRPWNS
jgi:hypothetical protein